MTLDNAKENVQQRYHYDISLCISFHLDEIAIEYGKAKWSEGAAAQKESCIRFYKVENSIIQYAPEPEFKP